MDGGGNEEKMDFKVSQEMRLGKWAGIRLWMAFIFMKLELCAESNEIQYRF